MDQIRTLLLDGMVIPAHPLALTEQRTLDERRQRALSRYYLASGAGGLAVGVHTTQFAIHHESIGLYRSVLEIAKEEIERFERQAGKRIIRIAGVIGDTAHAIAEARLARDLGYDAALLSLAALKHESNDALIEHCAKVGNVLPLFGFYLQPAIGGRILDLRFWRRFVELESVVAIKIAPFNRYQTLDVVRAVADAGREEDIALYTGNDDTIVYDLLSDFRFGEKSLRIIGGLLGQWAVWTKRATELLDEVKRIHRAESDIPREFMQLAQQLTDSNAALFDAANNFVGCIPGIHEVLRRQGLLMGTWCLDERETLSSGQREQIERVCTLYPHLTDDAFVAEHLDEWMS